ncbi:hypothetical protein [Dyadobacter sp. 3J3]|uniref:hypothetical protein n=1 Tax=Dyadobacter sp. 3J3 TaxID=2606600 RepID=UPI001358151D|nr:hypothetical protein [Dyadobacter sp. 3J3]
MTNNEIVQEFPIQPLIMQPAGPPTEEQIEETIALLYERLESPDMMLPINAFVREGYEEAVDILVDDIKDYRRISAKSIQGRAIAVLACDYLTGNCSREILIGVPLKHD